MFLVFSNFDFQFLTMTSRGGQYFYRFSSPCRLIEYNFSILGQGFFSSCWHTFAYEITTLLPTSRPIMGHSWTDICQYLLMIDFPHFIWRSSQVWTKIGSLVSETSLQCNFLPCSRYLGHLGLISIQSLFPIKLFLGSRETEDRFL